MKMHVVYLSLLLGITGLGLLAVDYSRTDSWRAPSPAGDGMTASSRSEVASTRPENGHPAMNEGPSAGMAGSDAGQVHLPVPYRDRLDLSVMSLEEMNLSLGLSELRQADGHLAMNHRTRAIVEELIQDVPREEILRNKSRLTQAVALRHGARMATDFARLLDQFIDYKDAIAAIDAERNAQGAKPADISDDSELRMRLQNQAFGAQDAAGLFQVERKTAAVIAKYEAALKNGTVQPGSELTAQIQKEFQDIQAEEGNP